MLKRNLLVVTPDNLPGGRFLEPLLKICDTLKR